MLLFVLWQAKVDICSGVKAVNSVKLFLLNDGASAGARAGCGHHGFESSHVLAISINGAMCGLPTCLKDLHPYLATLSPHILHSQLLSCIVLLPFFFLLFHL